MKYAESGKRSRAWWLQCVKWFGHNGTPGIMRGGEVATHHVKFAMEDLARAQYITRRGGGRGNKFVYYLSETGSRYLEEHKDELIEVVPAEKPKEIGAVVTGVHHKVPETPKWEGPPMPPENHGIRRGRPPAEPKVSTGVPIYEVQLLGRGRVLWYRDKRLVSAADVPVSERNRLLPATAATDQPEILRHTDSEAGASLTTSDEPPKPAVQSSLQRMRTDSVKSALKDLLYEKHADEISAKELIAYMESSDD